VLADAGGLRGSRRTFSALPFGLNPGDANAEANLGGALAETGRWKEARTHLERALEIDPNHILARENLEQVKRAAPSDKE